MRTVPPGAGKTNTPKEESTMRLHNEKVILRDMIAGDVEDRIRWETVETEWCDWDAPWESDPRSIDYVPFDEMKYRRECAEALSKPKDDAKARMSFEICANDGKETHIGWCNCYYINEDHLYTRGAGKHAIGIDIPPLSARRKGYATAAWTLFIRYLIEHGAQEIYTQTWSGNERVIGLIHKLGFVEVGRKKEKRVVRGAVYDALTFRLDREAFERATLEK